MLDSKLILSERHPFHVVNRSPWPFLVSLSTLGLVCFFIAITVDWNTKMHWYCMTPYVAPFFFFVYLWCNDIIKEATFEGHHTLRVQQGLRYGMVLFILSEVMFFFSFFVAYYYSSLSPAIEVFYWPPKGIDILNPLGIPLLNTVILLSSGVFITAAHKSIMQGHYIHTLIGILATIILGSIFTTLQVYEYVFATFFINDGIFGSLFFICTGFHGVHVIIGTVFLLVCLFRHLNYHFTIEQHLGFECAAWYWHFVDVVWLFLYFTIYWWSYEIADGLG